MNLKSWLCDCFSSLSHDEHSTPIVNPSTGLPMIDNNIGGIDAGGSPFGLDIHHSSSSMDCSGGFDWHDHR